MRTHNIRERSMLKSTRRSASSSKYAVAHRAVHRAAVSNRDVPGANSVLPFHGASCRPRTSFALRAKRLESIAGMRRVRSGTMTSIAVSPERPRTSPYVVVHASGDAAASKASAHIIRQDQFGPVAAN